MRFESNEQPTPSGEDGLVTLLRSLTIERFTPTPRRVTSAGYPQASAQVATLSTSCGAERASVSARVHPDIDHRTATRFR